MRKKIFFAGLCGLLALTACHSHKEHDHGDGEHAEEIDRNHWDAEANGGGDSHDGEGHGNSAGGGSNAGEIVISEKQAQAAGIVAERIVPADFHAVVTTSGSLQAAAGDETTVVATTAGVVRILRPVTAGTRVAKGQPLFRISAEHIQDGDPADKARIAYDRAKSDYERAARLVADKIVSEKEFNAIKENYDNARIAYMAVRGGSGRGGTTVSAAKEGFVVSSAVSDGDYVAAGQPLMTIARGSRLQLVADVPARHHATLGSITSAKFQSAYGGEVYDIAALNGRLMAYSRSSDAGSSFIPVTFECDSRGGIMPGMAVRVYLLTGVRHGVISLPVSAITEEQGAKFVYIKNDATCYEKREVTTGDSDGERIEIRSGLKGGETVVTKGAIQVRLASASNAIPAHSHSH